MKKQNDTKIRRPTREDDGMVCKHERQRNDEMICTHERRRDDLQTREDDLQTREMTG